MNTETLSPAEFATQLAHYYGSEKLFRHPVALPNSPKLIYTQGVEYFLENCGGGAYWFADIIATEVLPLQQQEEFIVIKMIVADEQAVITADDGNGNILWQRKVDYTDAFDGEWTFYLIDGTMLLPREY